jgi:type I restriction enzyme S subunit
MTIVQKYKFIESEKPVGDLPEGWALPSVSDLVEISYGKGLKESDRKAGPVDVYGSNGVVGKHNVALTKGPSIIIGRKGSIGAVHFSPRQCWPIDTTYYIDNFSRLDSQFLMHALHTLDLADLDTSTAIPGLNRNDVYEQKILLPPLAEQKRIVAKVEELLVRVNATKERLAKVSMILKRFRQSVLAAACSGRLTADWRSTQKELEPADQLVERIRKKYREQYEAECSKVKREGKRLPKKPEILESRKVETVELPEIPDEWTWIYLPALGHMSRGKSKHRPRNAPHLYGGPYPFIQTGDIAQSGGLITSHQQTYSEAGLAQSHLWPSGTICITIAANIANSALLTYPACFPDSVVGLIPDKSLCVKEFAEFFIRTARSNLDQFAPATAQKNINIEILSDVAVPLPPLAEQKEIVRRVEAMFKLADTIEKRLAAASLRAEKLTQAILAKAFRGELVPTEAELARRDGRSYEPASQLLACIKSERESKGVSERVRRSQRQQKSDGFKKSLGDVVKLFKK